MFSPSRISALESVAAKVEAVRASGAASQWTDNGTGYVGFRFNNGAGIQYGWGRVWITGHPENAFEVIDYAWGDVGDRIRAGQTSTNEMVPEEGSLGWLALGAAGLLAWRKRRSQAAP